jgi:hypothetical protein
MVPTPTTAAPTTTAATLTAVTSPAPTPTSMPTQTPWTRSARRRKPSASTGTSSLATKRCSSGGRRRDAPCSRRHTLLKSKCPDARNGIVSSRVEERVVARGLRAVKQPLSGPAFSPWFRWPDVCACVSVRGCVKWTIMARFSPAFRRRRDAMSSVHLPFTRACIWGRCGIRKTRLSWWLMESIFRHRR